MLGIFLDTETNGLDWHKHKILEIAFLFVDLNTGEIKYSFDEIVQISLEDWNRSSKQSLGVNGFTWEKVQNGKPIEQISDEIKKAFITYKIQRGQAIFICQNPSFDRSFFSDIIPSDYQEKNNWPYHWLDLASMQWTHLIKEGPLTSINVSKDAIAKAYGLDSEAYPHTAINGVYHLLECYKRVVSFPVAKPSAIQ